MVELPCKTIGQAYGATAPSWRLAACSSWPARFPLQADCGTRSARCMASTRRPFDSSPLLPN
eukprot:2642127-Alexandrium_andersonii.AAC.1